MRNPNPFTKRQIRLLSAVSEKIREITDPEPEIITDEQFDWKKARTCEFGELVKIGFGPYACQTKAELVRKAGLTPAGRDEELAKLRQQHGIKQVTNREARLFEAEWNNAIFKVKKALFTVGLMNYLFAFPGQDIAEPIRIMQRIVMDEYFPVKPAGKKGRKNKAEPSKPAETQKNRRIKPYDEQLAELE